MKILAVSDIHCHDYPQRNPVEKYRLYQVRIVAQNIIEAAQREGAEIIVLAGDILEKPVIRPYVQAEVKYFLDTLMSYFKTGFIIWGNHDQDNKGSNQEFTDSCISVMLPPNLYYADKRETVIDGSRIAFSNWQPEFDLSWINGTVDVLFTHATISYTGGDLYKSQELDESKFNLAICGDIHRPAQLGKYVSIGIPQRCKMGDCDKSTGVIYDTATKGWSWVDLDPQGKLMKFEYTPIREEEGWKQDIGTWKVYKPQQFTLSGTQREEIKVPRWEEIGHLIDGIIIENGLENVHSEVLKNIKNIESKEVDFNFVLTRFYCKNWRSIEEIELYFEDLDKVLITGKNGSGKSSLLSALRFAFEENRFLKDFIQFGQKECVTEVDFIYQGKTYRLQRGSKKYGLWVEGEPQKYNNKKEFEDDMHLRFPFIDYMDMYFFDSDHHKLIGSITPERKSEIISKFFKMDKIDAYNEEAEVLMTQFQKSVSVWTEEIEKSTKLLEFIDNKLSLIIVPGTPKDILEQHKAEGLDLQRRWKAWNDYSRETAGIQAQIQQCENKLQTLALEIQSFRDSAEIDREILELRELGNLKMNELGNLRSIASEWSIKQRNLADITKEGQKLYSEWQNIEQTKICSTCGQEIKSTESLEFHKVELEKRIQELVEKQGLIKTEMDALKEKKENADQETMRINRETSQINSKISELMSQKKMKESKKTEYKSTEAYGQSLHTRLLGMGQMEEVNLPDGFMEEMARIENEISLWTSYETLLDDRAKACESIQRAQNEIGVLSIGMDELSRYIKITGPTGKIYEEIMTRLADQFSDNQVKYEVVTYNFRKKDHLDLASYFFNNGNWVGYQACSSGQQTVLDVNFLSKIITRMGLLVMDEFLKHLDPFNHDICIDMISSMNIGCIMLSSHMESIVSFNNKSIQMELNDSGMTKLEMK